MRGPTPYPSLVGRGFIFAKQYQTIKERFQNRRRSFITYTFPHLPGEEGLGVGEGLLFQYLLTVYDVNTLLSLKQLLTREVVDRILDSSSCRTLHVVDAINNILRILRT